MIALAHTARYSLVLLILLQNHDLEWEWEACFVQLNNVK
jgi:hypothetical protein